ncbi:MAG: EAL domain-containing protein [Gammaproteobacteria bacterium]|nr:EAL domain-containing protein [Gammaproteobacteria bacterium]
MSLLPVNVHVIAACGEAYNESIGDGWDGAMGCLRSTRQIEYIKHARRFSLIKKVDKLLLEKSLKLLSEKCSDNENNRFNIPLSHQTVCDTDFLAYLDDLLNKYSLSANSLIIEFREEDVVHHLNALKPVMENLNDMGCMLSVAGVGHSSMQFSYLQNLPVDLIRVDQSIIEHLEKDNFTQVLVKSIIEVGHILYKNVGAEGVDSISSANLLINMGADCIQGNGVKQLMDTSNH